MTAQGLVASLDLHLAAVGEDIELRRYNGAVLVDTVICRAVARGYDPEELVGGIIQTDIKFILSPSEIIATGWPGPEVPAGSSDRDRRVPNKGDKIIRQGREFAVQNSNGGFYVDNELVRIELQGRGS